MKVIDCFMFYNEFKMLEFRLTELYDCVDHFVLVESTKTHSNQNKILFFNENKEKYKKFLDKIIHVIVDDNPNDTDSWIRERYQRYCILNGLNKIDGLKDDDIIIISDCDEIVNTEVINKIINNQIIINTHKIVELDLYYYNLENYRSKWQIPIFKYSHIKNTDKHKYVYGASGALRTTLASDDIIKKGGWHFSYFMNIEKIKNKIDKFAHQEYNNNYYKNNDRINNCIKNNKDLYSRCDLKKISIKDNNFLPKNYKLLLDMN